MSTVGTLPSSGSGSQVSTKRSVPSPASTTFFCTSGPSAGGLVLYLASDLGSGAKAVPRSGADPATAAAGQIRASRSRRGSSLTQASNAPASRNSRAQRDAGADLQARGALADRPAVQAALLSAARRRTALPGGE